MKAGGAGGIALKVAGIVAILFGVLTIREGGNVLFGDGNEGCAGGQYVRFVVWFNFLAGFAYIIAGFALWLRRRWAGALALIIAVATLLVFIAFGIHVLSGGGYEMRTVGAMSLRTLVWFAIAFVAHHFIMPPRQGFSL